MVDSSGEDTRKKRDNAQVRYEDEEKPKKIQKGERNKCGDDKEREVKDDDDDDSNAAILPSPTKRRATERATSGGTNGNRHSHAADETANNSSPRKQQKVEPHYAAAQIAAVAAKRQAISSQGSDNLGNTKSKREIWDLESAMLYLVRLNKLSDANSVLERDGTAGRKPRASNPSTNPPASPQPRPQHREYLTPEKDSWITFGMAHSGDAATIANWYHVSQQEKEDEMAKQQQQEEEEKPEIAVVRETVEETEHDGAGDIQNRASQSQHLPMLEHWLAEGLGDDEVTCPSVYGLLAYVHMDGENTKLDDDKNDVDKKESKTDENDQDEKPRAFGAKGQANDHRTKEVQSSQPRMAAVVLLTLAWTSNERHLRVEWMAIDSKNLSTPIAKAVQQKVWLRISALSVMTACPVIDVDEMLLVEARGKSEKEIGEENQKSSKKKTIPPSAE